MIAVVETRNSATSAESRLERLKDERKQQSQYLSTRRRWRCCARINKSLAWGRREGLLT